MLKTITRFAIIIGLITMLSAAPIQAATLTQETLTIQDVDNIIRHSSRDELKQIKIIIQEKENPSENETVLLEAIQHELDTFEYYVFGFAALILTFIVFVWSERRRPTTY